ncbi:hypothetical protein BC830DRAFT_1086607, partial [Chytriomyces sp. MP71]
MVQAEELVTHLGVVRVPVVNVEVKLVEVDGTDSKPTNAKPQGEVWIRGEVVMKGYCKRPDLTREVITEDGWLMTGDIGELDSDGTYTLIDRKKNLVKLANGELYIGLEEHIMKSRAAFKILLASLQTRLNHIPLHSSSLSTRNLLLPSQRRIKLFPGITAETVDFAAICARPV